MIKTSSKRKIKFNKFYLNIKNNVVFYVKQRNNDIGTLPSKTSTVANK